MNAGKWLTLAMAGTAMTLATLASPGGAAVCEPLSPMSDNVLSYGTDYRPRIDFQVPDADGPSALPMSEELEFPLYAWNLYEGMQGASFRIVSSGLAMHFTPAPGLTAFGGGTPQRDGGLLVLDVNLLGQDVCGPVLLGHVSVTPNAESPAVFVDVKGLGGDGLPLVLDGTGAGLPAIAPHHGAYAGAFDPYHGQPALCEEPLRPVADLTAVQTGGMVIELGWTAGDGDATMIRYRADGRFPLSVHDGELLAVFPAFEGQWQTMIHSYPDVSHYWYTAFNVRLDGETVMLGSQLECGSFTAASVDESVANENTTWSTVKRRFR